MALTAVRKPLSWVSVQVGCVVVVAGYQEGDTIFLSSNLLVI